MTGLGYNPDPPDTRDRDAGPVLRAAVMAVPAFVGRTVYVKTLDQGGLGSCTANAAGQAIRADEVKQLVEEQGKTLAEAQQLEFASRLFWYYLARAIDGTTQEDLGTYIRNIFLVANKVGFPPESVWPYSDSSLPGALFSKMPSSEAFRRAFDQKALTASGGSQYVSYSRIFSTGYARVDEIKMAHGAGHMVVFGTQVSAQFCGDMSANGGKEIAPPVGMSIAGGHAMCTGGHDANGADVLNSWGLGFGDGGWCRFSWDYMAWDRTTDLWIVKRAPLITA